MTDDGTPCDGDVVPRARRCFSADCEIVLAVVIVLACFVGAMILFAQMYGVLGVAAWVVAHGAWWYAGTRHRLADWNFADVGIFYLSAFAAQNALNAHWNHVGNLVFIVGHAIAITAAIRHSSFPRARARRRQCSSG